MLSQRASSPNPASLISSVSTIPFASSFLWLFVMIVLGWAAVYWIYDKAGKVKGF